LFLPRSWTVHPSARPWLPRIHRAAPVLGLASLAAWSVRRPIVVGTTLALLVRGFGREPRLLAGAMAAACIGAAHATTMRRLRIEHVHAHFATNPATAAWVIERLTGIPYSVTVHGYDLFQDQAFLERRLRDARFVVTISDFNARFLSRFAPGLPTPVHVVRTGLDPARYRYRRRLVPLRGRVRALSVASLMRHKGHHVLLEALATDDPELGRIDLDLVGDGPLRGELEALARRLGLSGRVRFHGDLAEDRVAELLAEADLFVLASRLLETGRGEALPVSVVEALAGGVPAVATRLTGVPELVRDGETGVLAAQGDMASLREAVKRVLADPEAAARRAERGRALVEREYDVERSAARLARLFAEAARGRSAI
jgi:colanic acid/amylovoran biosynthesis glycosyltransferase